VPAELGNATIANEETVNVDRLSARHLGQRVTVFGREAPDLTHDPVGPASEWDGELLALSIYPEGILAVLDVDGARTAILCAKPEESRG